MTVEGVAGLRRRWLNNFSPKLRKRLRKAMEKGADEIVAFAKLLAPEDEGDLLNSIGWTWGDAPEGSLVLGGVEASQDDEEFRITIYAGNERTIVTNSRGVRFQNALLQEFGTKNQPANPFFFVAYRALRTRTRSRMTREARKVFQEENGA